MLNLIGDWYKLVGVAADDARLLKRRSAASRLSTSLTSAKPSVVQDFVGFALEAIGAAGNAENPTSNAVVAQILEDEPSFERDGGSSRLDTRICAAVALGEFLSGSGAVRRKSGAAVAASALCSALRHRQAAADYAQKCAGQLLDLAESVLDGVDERRRQRKDTALSKFEKSVAEPESDLLEAVRSTLSIMNEEMLKDREELQALWWLFGGYSHRESKPFAQLPRGTAAIVAGVELAEILEAPATQGMASLAGRAARAATGATEIVSLKELAASLAPGDWAYLTQGGVAAQIVSANPVLFPITALANRFKVGRDITAALAEPGSLDGSTMISSVDLAAQVFSERLLLATTVERS